jgi:hypothetical protein
VDEASKAFVDAAVPGVDKKELGKLCDAASAARLKHMSAVETRNAWDAIYAALRCKEPGEAQNIALEAARQACEKVKAYDPAGERYLLLMQYLNYMQGGPKPEAPTGECVTLKLKLH